MRSIQYHQYGGPELMRLEEVEPGSPGNGQMLVRVRAAAANPKDWKVRSGATNLSAPHARGRQARHSPVANGPANPVLTKPAPFPRLSRIEGAAHAPARSVLDSAAVPGVRVR